MSLLYRNGVGIFLLNDKKKLWVGRRLDSNIFWQMPQGGIDNDESEEEAMKRELEEEIGTKNVKIIKKSKKLLNYDIPSDMIKKVWNGKFKGQAQRWFACKFRGSDSEINVATKVAEFVEWRWIDPELVVDAVIPFKKKMYRSILKEFSDLYC